jgi:heme O synthase-like polyprenyltransferase
MTQKKNNGILPVIMYILIIAIVDVVFVRVFDTKYLVFLMLLNFGILYIFWRIYKKKNIEKMPEKRTSDRKT